MTYMPDVLGSHERIGDVPKLANVMAMLLSLVSKPPRTKYHTTILPCDTWNNHIHREIHRQTPPVRPVHLRRCLKGKLLGQSCSLGSQPSPLPLSRAFLAITDSFSLPGGTRVDIRIMDSYQTCNFMVDKIRLDQTRQRVDRAVPIGLNIMTYQPRRTKHLPA